MFLAIVMVPAVIDLGVNPLAAHLFVIYWASVSYITPPVGLAAFAAAGLAKAPAMATSVAAMKLGAVKYIVPFGFALNPALVAQDSPGRILLAFALSIVGVYALASAIEGWPVVRSDRRSADAFLGREEVFAGLWFECVAHPAPGRVIMRREIGG